MMVGVCSLKPNCILLKTMTFFMNSSNETFTTKCLKAYKPSQVMTENSQQNFIFSQVITIVLFNQLIGYVLAYFVFCCGDLLNLKVSRSLPSFSKVMFDLVICLLCQEIGFYYSHRLLHSKMLYKRLHKLHHKYQAPYGLTAIYCHPIEHILSNILPVVAAFPVLKCHVSTALLWITIALTTTINDHSGYHLPFLHSSELHDYHHLK